MMTVIITKKKKVQSLVCETCEQLNILLLSLP